jgi:hypothetical protein
MKANLRFAIWLGALLVGKLPSLSAQGTDPAQALPLAVLVSNLFGPHTAFTALAKVENAPLDAPSPLQLSLCRLGDRLWLNIDLRQIPQATGTPIPTGLLSKFGVDRAIAVGRLDGSSVWQIRFPKLEAYYEEALLLNDPRLRLLARGARIERTVLGKETLDGHPCVKHKLVASLKNEREPLGFVWEAGDMRKFPLRFDLMLEGQMTTIRLHDVKFGRADASYFDLPAGYQRYKDLQQILLVALQNSLLGNPASAK